MFALFQQGLSLFNFTTQFFSAIAAPERLGEVRYYGTINNEAQAVRQLQGLYGNILSCYEAGPCGFGLYHQLTAMNIKC
ncbi:hypothetical protein BTQ07_09285 [Escherichia coli]|nr:hypothetical protein BTQ07_09285 [Escherichia coli]